MTVLGLVLVSGFIFAAAEAGSALTDTNSSCPIPCDHGKCENGLCKCDEGWGKLMNIPFLGCGIPQCDFRLSCNAVDPGPPPPFQFQLNPCMIPFICGEGGACEGALIGLNYTCKCHEGYRNLFDAPSAMCFRSCQVGGACSQLNIGVLPPPPPPPPATAPPPSRGERTAVSWPIAWYVPMLALISLRTM